jgi:hypothetical protein
LYGELVNNDFGDDIGEVPEDEYGLSDEAYGNRLFAWWARRVGVLVHVGRGKRHRGVAG